VTAYFSLLTIGNFPQVGYVDLLIQQRTRAHTVRAVRYEQAMSQPRLVLADDHLESAELLRDLLEQEFDVVAEVQDGLALVRAAERLTPDVIVSDISMPGLDGLSAARLILRGNPAARIVFVTVHGDPLLVERGLAAGALAYVVKRAAGDELIPAVRSALRGERHVNRERAPQA
jgi:DNA-binding NarL/FixJ family response regulator